MKPLCIDLFCGLGGWAEGFLAEGYRVVGFDIDPRFAKVYPGEFVLADVTRYDGRRFRDALCIVASPPCNQFSKLNDIGHRRKGPPDTTLFQAAMRIGYESGRPFLIENVDRAQAFVGRARCHRGAYFFWGDVPMLATMPLRPKIGGSFLKERPSHRFRHWATLDRGKMGAALRAKIPVSLARAVAVGFLTQQSPPSSPDPEA